MNMYTRRIKKLMIDKNVSNSELALLAGCDNSMISHVIRLRKKSKHIERVIAMRLGVDIDRIFPHNKAA